MNLIFPINFVGHDEWMNSGYATDLAGGDVITSEGEILGEWRVTGYDLEEDHTSGQYEFVINGQCEPKFSKKFALLDSRMHRGLALSEITHLIRKWHEVYLT